MMNHQPPFVVFGEEWGLHPTSTQYLARRLARTRRLLYVNTVGLRPPRLNLYDVRRSFGKLRQWFLANGTRPVNGLPNLHFYSPVRLPFNRFEAIRNWNRQMLLSGLRQQLRLHNLEAPILSVTLPIGAEVVGQLDESLLVYYIIDQYEEMPGWDRNYVRELESLLLSKADLVFVTSAQLQKEKRASKAPVLLLPHGVEFEHFYAAASQPSPVPEEFRELPRPLLGFYGLLAPWVDTTVLEQLARAFPKASVVVIGPRWHEGPLLGSRPNLHWLGPRSYKELPRYAAHFDVGLIPFRMDRLTRYASPLKFLEYLALGLPIVSTPLPEFERFADVVYPARSSEEFIEQVRLALEDRTPERRQLRFARAAAESWDARVTTMQQHIEQALRARMVR